MSIQENINEYIRGTLPEEEIEKLWIEFAKNPELLDQLELEVSVKELLKKEAAQHKPKKATIHQLPDWIWHASAAAAILLVVFIQIFREPTPTQLSQFLENQISPLQFENIDAVRGKTDKQSSSDSLFSLAVQAATINSAQQAIALYNELLLLNPGEPFFSKAHLNLGIIYYNKSEYEESANRFNTVINQEQITKRTKEKAYWYLANALANLEKLEEARDAVYEAYKLEGRFKDSAFRLLRKLDYDLGNTKAEPTQ